MQMAQSPFSCMVVGPFLRLSCFACLLFQVLLKCDLQMESHILPVTSLASESNFPRMEKDGNKQLLKFGRY